MKKLLILMAFALSFTSCVYVVRRTPDTTTTTYDPPPTTTTTSVGVTISFGVEVGNVIQDFQPDRGTGSTYLTGEQISLRLVSREAGYVTLVIYNPGDYRNAEIRNIPVQSGVNFIPRNNTLTAAPPAGMTRFRAFFTPEPNNNVSFTSGANERYLETQTSAYLNPYPVQLRDVKETYLFVR